MSYCCNRRRNGNGARKRVELVMLKSQLMYDIRTGAWVIGDVMKTDDDHDRHQVQDIGEDNNVDWVARQLDLVHGIILQLLRKLTKATVRSTIDDDEIDYSQEEYRFPLYLPVMMKQATVKYLKELIHNLMVAWVIMDWMSITHKEEYQTWVLKVEDLKEKLKDALDDNGGITYLRPSVF